jgi:hypothetical protein
MMAVQKIRFRSSGYLWFSIPAIAFPMSLLFAPPAPLQAELLVHDHAEEFSRLGRQLWESLSQQTSSKPCLSIRPLTNSRQGRLPSVISWASLDESVCTFMPSCSIVAHSKSSYHPLLFLYLANGSKPTSSSSARPPKC